jgi:signal peptidase II
MSGTRALLLLLAIVGTVGCDRGTKHLASAQLAGQAARSYLGGAVRLVYAENPGAFLSLGAAWPEWARRGVLGLVVAGSLVGIALVAWRHRGGGATTLGLGLILAGGGSNLFDRVVWGHVVDFMVLRAGPLQTGVFNVADVAIMLGVALVLFAGRKAARERQPASRATP